jgi:hypothetical protein
MLDISRDFIICRFNISLSMKTMKFLLHIAHHTRLVTLETWLWIGRKVTIASVSYHLLRKYNKLAKILLIFIWPWYSFANYNWPIFRKRIKDLFSCYRKAASWVIKWKSYYWGFYQFFTLRRGKVTEKARCFQNYSDD